MILYENTLGNFICSTNERRIVNYFAEEYFNHFSRKLDSETKNQWKYIIFMLKDMLESSEFNRNSGIRIDYVITQNFQWFEVILSGKNTNVNKIHVLEVLPFEKVYAAVSDDVYEFEIDDNKVEFVHPSVQSICYKEYLKSNLSAVSEEEIEITSCVFLMECNARESIEILFEKSAIIKEAPIFLAGEENELCDSISWLKDACEGVEVLNILHNRDQLCSAGLDSYIDDLFSGSNSKEYLFSEQKYAAAKIIQSVVKKEHNYFILNGLAGTGKTTVAISVMKKLLDLGYEVLFLTASRMLVEALKTRINENTDTLFEIDTVQTFVRKDINKHYDLIIVDEAQNIGTLFINEYLKKVNDNSQSIMFSCSMLQCISNHEEDFLDLIGKVSEETEKTMIRLDLNRSIRYSGQASGINWLLHQLQIAETGNYDDWDVDRYMIDVITEPEQIIPRIKEEEKKGNVCKAIATYFSISSISEKYGEPRVELGNNGYSMPVITGQMRTSERYEAMHNSEYAVGSLLMQGMEIDYGCVLITHLTYNEDTGKIELKKEVKENAVLSTMSAIGMEDVEEGYLRKILNSYYIAISRGKKGTLLYCDDDKLSEFIKHKIIYASRRYSWIKDFISNYSIDGENGIIKNMHNEKKKESNPGDKYAYVTLIYNRFNELIESIKKEIHGTIDEKSFKKICDQCSTVLLDLQRDAMNDDDIASQYTEEIIKTMGKESWDKLNDLSKKCLISAEIIFHDLKDYNQIFDFSGVCVQVSKAVEYELAYRYLTEYVAYLKKKYGNKLMDRIPKSLLDDDGQIKTEDLFTLGDVRYAVGMDARGNVKNQYVFKQFGFYAKEKLLKNTRDIQKILADHIIIVDKIRKDYRNKAAHKSPVDVVAAKDCIDYVVEAERKLGLMLDEYNY